MLLASIFAKGVDDGYGGIMYIPTTFGYVALVLVILLALLAASFLLGKKELNISTKQLAVSAVCIALAFVTSNIPIIKMPFGGSATLLSMLFIALIGYWYGIGAGILSGVAYGILQLIIDPYILTLPQMLVDYPLAFGALGLSGVGYHINKTYGGKYCSFGGLQIGYLVGVLGRYFFAFLSGWIFFGEYAWEGWSAVPYSLAYNGAYLGTEAAITLIIIALPPVAKALNHVKKMLNKPE